MKFRITISLVRGDTMITDVYVAQCANMYEAMAKASRYAAFQMDEEDKRHQALLHILRVQSNDGVEVANEYLKKNHLAPLSF